MKFSVHLIAAVLSLSLFGCANFRAYFNAYFNGQKAFDQAQRSRAERMELNPHDSIDVTPEENKLLERAIEKYSKVLELHRERPNEYLSRSLFMMGECYMLLKEYPKAIVKYDELEVAYPNYEEIETARFHRAVALFHTAKYPTAKKALLEYLAKSANSRYKNEAMELYAVLETQNNSPEEGLKIYEDLLKDKSLSPELKGNIYLEAAQIAYDLKNWARARELASAGEIKKLPVEKQFRAACIRVRSLYFLGKLAGAIVEWEAVLSQALFAPYKVEVSVELGKWSLEAGNKASALGHFALVHQDSLKTGYSAEAYYYLAEYLLNKEKDEEQALATYDSSVATGTQFEYALLSAEKSASLKKIFELRSQMGGPEVKSEFMLAEMFLFNLNNVDSALEHLNAVANDTTRDSVFSVKAAYARAFVYDEFVDSKSVSDSMYEYVIQNFPHTDYAKQAEYNLGRVVTTQTEEDLAHDLFLKAEELFFGGYDLVEQVIPAYRQVVDSFPQTETAAKSQFVMAMLYELSYDNGDTLSHYLAKRAHAAVREGYKDSRYYPISHAKLLAAGIKPGDSISTALPIYVPEGDAGSEPASTSPVPAPGRKPNEFQEAEDTEEVLE